MIGENGGHDVTCRPLFNEKRVGHKSNLGHSYSRSMEDFLYGSMSAMGHEDEDEATKGHVGI